MAEFQAEKHAKTLLPPEAGHNERKDVGHPLEQALLAGLCDVTGLLMIYHINSICLGRMHRFPRVDLLRNTDAEVWDAWTYYSHLMVTNLMVTESGKRRVTVVQYLEGIASGGNSMVNRYGVWR